MIIDAHVYCLPERLRSCCAKLPKSERMIRDAIYTHPEGEWALSLSSPEAILSSMKKNKIDSSVLVSLPWRSSKLCQENNDYVFDAAASNKKFLAICSIQPKRDGWQQEALRCIKAGAIGIKVNPRWQGFALDGKEMDAVARFICKHNRFLMVHVDHAFRKSDASAACLWELAKRHLKTRIVAAHLGGLLGLYAHHAPVKKALQNVWFDTAVSSTVDMVGFYVDAGMRKKVIFGSDFPFNHSHDQATVLRGIKGLKISKAQKAAILGGNFLTLLRKRS